MSVKIKDIEVCSLCGNKDCSYKDARVKTNFYGLRTEETVCPTTVLTDGPLDKAKGNMLDDKDCIDCGLCERSCHNNNIECVDVDFCKNSFVSLSTQQCNAIACSYLNHIFEFAANTNRNKALQFDGYASTVNGKEAFVQIDQDNDSLESVRRLIGDFLLYSPADRKIQIGIVVLQELPKEGSRDVYNVLESLKNFPTTSDYKFYFTTFKLLRFIALHLESSDFDFANLLLDLSDNNNIPELYSRLKKVAPDKDEEIKLLLNIV